MISNRSLCIIAILKFDMCGHILEEFSSNCKNEISLYVFFLEMLYLALMLSFCHPYQNN